MMFAASGDRGRTPPRSPGADDAKGRRVDQTGSTAPPGDVVGIVVDASVGDV
jgi:hypothetical protein